MQRIKKLAESLIDADGCFIDNPVDLLYLTGLTLSKGRLWVSKNDACLFVDGRYFETAVKTAPCKVKIWEEQKKVKASKIAFDSAFVSYNDALSLRKAFPEIEWIPIPNPTRQIRVCKDPKEIGALRKACELTWLGYLKVKQSLRVGVTEAELALEFESFCRRNGASGLSFESIIAFGENSAYPHHRAGLTKLRNDQIVLIDVGAVVDQYHGDMTRVVYFGEPDPRLQEFEQIVRRAQRKAISHIKPGIAVGTLDQIVRDEFDTHNVKPLYIHNMGHGIGLDTHEFPRIRFDGEDANLILKAGMVFTVEPGLYQPGIGGIRWEDMVMVTENGCEVLSDFSETSLPLDWKTDFPAIVSHELSGPITIIKGCCELLPSSEIVDKISASCERLEKTFKSLLAMSDLGQAHFENIDLLKVADLCKNAILAKYPNAQIHIQSDRKTAPLLADSNLLEIAIQNLLDNAIKYSMRSGDLKISIQHTNGDLSLSVTDHGIGIAEEEIPKIFDRFYCVDKARSRKLGGVGLGLAIVQAIAALHKGRIEVRSQLGKGSTFTLIFEKLLHD